MRATTRYCPGWCGCWARSKNAKAWEQRNVSHEGTTYRCEWHGKRRWDRDRVHFSLPIPEHDDRVLVGIFVGHLAT
ncbi:hypothetical protein [Streptomyces salinarius]|uniref:Uncharacterized protein n=1 Tax=Streptomyces salinarius TaxID=2762598 RepID=A0ABW8B400_9ACTN